MPSISTSNPTMHGVAGSHTWSVALSIPSSLTMIGSFIMDGSGSAAAVGSGFSSVQQDDGWLVSGSGVGLEISSSAGQTVNGDPFFSSTHSTKAAKSSLGLFAGRRALHHWP